MHRLIGLELLRGLAALLVLGGHLKYAVRNVCGPDVAMPRLLETFCGPCGVDLFFVLSGYLIALTLNRPRATARSFLAARLARVVPLYFAVSLACVAVPMFRSYPLSPEMLVTTFAYLPAWGDALNPTPAHPYGWTLSFEVGFYLTATSLAALFGARRAGLALIGVFALAPVVFTCLGPVSGWDFPGFACSPLTAEFALGALAYRVAPHLPRGASVVVPALGGLLLWNGWGRLEDYSYAADLLADPRLAWGRVAAWGLPAFLLVLGAARLEADFGALPTNPATRLASWLGAISYALYLVQPFSFIVVTLVAPRLGIASPWPVAAATIAATVALAAFMERYLDRPLHQAARALLTRRPDPSRQATLASNSLTLASIKSRTLR